MDNNYGKPLPLSLPSHSIEMFFPTTLARGGLGFVDFVDRAIDNLSNANYTFFAGYVSLRFTGQTRTYLGMQQWKQTCAVEISVIQGVQNLPNLLGGLLNIGLDGGGLAHWGQHVDWAFKHHGSVYPQYAKWRQIYAKMSNNFANRTFENGLSLRWNLTTPNDAQFISQTVPDVMEPGQSQSVTVTMRNTGITTWTRSASYRLGESLQGQPGINWGIHRVELPADIPPGAQVTFQFNIVAPSKGIGSGITRLFEWKMLQEMVEWFGVDTPLKTIRIVPKKGTTVTVPDVIEDSEGVAKSKILDAFLDPSFTGSTGQSGAWVDDQSPKSGTVVAIGSTVKVHLKTGLRP